MKVFVLFTLSCRYAHEKEGEKIGLGVGGGNPTTNSGMRNGSSVGTCTHRIHVFARLALICNAQSVLINKISASELRRKLTKSALLVGKAKAR